MYVLKKIARGFRWLFVFLAFIFVSWIFHDYLQHNASQGIGNYLFQIIGLVANLFGILAGFSKDPAPEIKNHIDASTQRTEEIQ